MRAFSAASHGATCRLNVFYPALRRLYLAFMVLCRVWTIRKLDDKTGFWHQSLIVNTHVNFNGFFVNLL